MTSSILIDAQRIEPSYFLQVQVLRREFVTALVDLAARGRQHADFLSFLLRVAGQYLRYLDHFLTHRRVALVIGQEMNELFELPQYLLDVEGTQNRNATFCRLLRLARCLVGHQASDDQLRNLVSKVLDKDALEKLRIELLLPTAKHLIQLWNRI